MLDFCPRFFMVKNERSDRGFVEVISLRDDRFDFELAEREIDIVAGNLAEAFAVDFATFFEHFGFQKSDADREPELREILD